MPASKIGDESSGNLRLLAQVTGNLTFTLVLDVTSEEGVSESTLENTIKETIRQIGARLVGEKGVGVTGGSHTPTTLPHTSWHGSPGTTTARASTSSWNG